MEENEIITSNRLIADWMQLPKCDRCDGCGMYKLGAGAYFTPIQIGYHTSWDRLMQVIQRIEKEGEVMVTINREATTIKIYSKLPDEYAMCLWKTTKYDQEIKINHVYSAVLQFIIHSNTLNPPSDEK